MNTEGLPKGLQDTISYFSKFPGIGEKSASRMAFFLLQKTPEYNELFGNTLLNLHNNVGQCQQCFHLCETHEAICSICSNHKRDQDVLCIVESSLDLLALESSGSYTGKYFVLGGVIAPMEGIGPEELRIELLKTHLSNNTPQEIIFALSSTMEGEATTVYVSELLKKNFPQISITRIARGISLGSSIQYTDKNTLERAFSGRGNV